MKGFVVACIVIAVIAGILYVFQRSKPRTRWAFLVELILSLFI